MVSAKIEVDSRPGDYAWSLGVPRFEGDIWSIDVKPQEFADKLINNNYKYVYVYKADDIFKNVYGSLFGDTQIENETMYKVNINKNTVILSELK